MAKHIDRICAVIAALAVLLTALLMVCAPEAAQAAPRELGYESRLFDTGRVHTIDIVMDDWDSFLETCEDENYTVCAVVIDGESTKNVGIRAKGNTSLSTVSALGSERYSFKLEFDHYESGKSYYGLDKLSLNNLIQDNTCMKDYLVCRMMASFGVAAPLCSYVWVTVNGADWGLYLAVEGVEDAFLQRNYGSDAGKLYKPDSSEAGGGPGNGRSFDMAQFQDKDSSRGMTAADVRLQYSGDDPDYYENIFENSKTAVTDADRARLIDALATLGGDDPAAALDTEAVLRYFVVHNFVCNGDSYTGSIVHNYYLCERDGRLSMIPWDYNLAFGTFGGGGASAMVNDPIDQPLSTGGSDARPMFDWITADEAYTAQYHAYFAEFLETVDVSSLIDEAYALIAPYVAQDPTAFCTEAEFEAGVEALRTFCALRAGSVQAQLGGTLPTTADRTEEDALVDASELDLSAMGAMNGGSGAAAAEPPQDFDGKPQQDAGGEPPQGLDGETVPEFGGRMNRDGLGAMPAGEPPADMPQAEPAAMRGAAEPEQAAPQNWLLLGASALVLAVGLLAARKFCRRSAV